MAKRNIIVSDLNGEEVTEEDGAKLTVTYYGRDTIRVLDVTAKEADELFAGGRELKKRGRKATNGNGAAATSTAARGRK